MGRLLAEFRQRDCALLYLDCGFNILDPLIQEFPDRCFNTGCREQATVSMAAGMQSEGIQTFVYSIASFLIFRALEQIRIDLVYSRVPVKLIGYGAGCEKFEKLGFSHTTSDEDLFACNAIGLATFKAHLVKTWLGYRGPAYLRLT